MLVQKDTGGYAKNFKYWYTTKSLQGRQYGSKGN